MKELVCDIDDFGSNHIISDQCQTRDCREELDKLHYTNPKFKATLFAVPAEMTPELLEWCDANKGWVELAVHGWKHASNWECAEWTYKDMDKHMQKIRGWGFVRGFKAPGWQISQGCYEWLLENGWWIADQEYNTARRPLGLSAYVNDEGKFRAYVPAMTGVGVNALGVGSFSQEVNGLHGHTWTCCDNGIDDKFPMFQKAVAEAEDFKFISELFV